MRLPKAAVFAMFLARPLRDQISSVAKSAGERFAAVRGRAEVKWQTRDLMKLLRDEP